MQNLAAETWVRKPGSEGDTCTVSLGIQLQVDISYVYEHFVGNYIEFKELVIPTQKIWYFSLKNWYNPRILGLLDVKVSGHSGIQVIHLNKSKHESSENLRVKHWLFGNFKTQKNVNK